MPLIELESPRLRLRPVRSEDLDLLAVLGADPRVMETLGGVMSRDATRAWLDRLVEHWQKHGYGRFLVSRDSTFVGVVGLSRADFDDGIVPGVEIAWRLAFDQWDRGYATEAAHAVVGDGFGRLCLSEIIAATTPHNARSRGVMHRLGMVLAPADSFDHPRLPEGDPRRRHVVYRITERQWQSASSR